MDLEQEIFIRVPTTIASAISCIKKKGSMGNYKGRCFSRIIREFFEKYPPIDIEMTDLFIVIRGKAFHPDKNLYRIASKSLLLTGTIADWQQSSEIFSGDYRTVD